VVAAQSMLITKPASTPTLTEPHSVYDFTSIAVSAAGKVVRNPTLKLFKPFTTAVQTKTSVFSNGHNNIVIEDVEFYEHLYSSHTDNTNETQKHTHTVEKNLYITKFA